MKLIKTAILTIVFAIVASTAMAQTSQSTEFYFFHDVDPVPVNLRDITGNIDYPDDAIADNIQGSVVFRVFVNKKGECSNHYTLAASHPALAQYAEEQVVNIKFEPALKAGEPVAAWVNIPFKFEIRN